MDRFQIVLGHYVYYLECHGGQWSPEYARMCKITKYFTPGYRALCLDTEGNELAKEVYDNLCEKNDMPSYNESHG